MLTEKDFVLNFDTKSPIIQIEVYWSAIFLARSHENNKRLKHINVKLFFIAEKFLKRKRREIYDNIENALL